MAASCSLMAFLLILCVPCFCYAGQVEDRLLNWLSEHGGTFKGIGVDTFEGMGRGIAAVRNIREGDDVLKIPTKLIISVKNAFSSPDLIHRKIAKMFKNQEQAVIGLVAFEKLKGNESLWAPYFAILPHYVPNFAFSGFLPAELQDEKLEKDAANTLTSLRKSFDVFRKTSKQFWPASVPAPSFEIYQWASAIIDSRALRFEGEIKLIPIADIFNYAPHPVPRKKSGGNFFLQHHKLNEKGLVITADRDCPKGSQLLEDYGDNEDAIYAQYHGFVAEENPFRCVEFKTDFVADMSGKPESLRKVFQALKINSNMRKCIDYNGDIGLGMIVYESALAFDDAEIVNCANAISVKEGNWNEIFDLCGFSEVQAELFQFISDNNRGIVEDLAEVSGRADTLFSRFLSGVQTRLSRYMRAFPTSLQYDEDLLRKIGDELRFSPEEQESPFAQEKNLEKLNLSVRYRVALKRHWVHLCCLYQATCCSMTSENAGNFDVAGKNTFVHEEASHEAKYRSMDWDTLTLEDKLAVFMEWFDAAKPGVNKVKPAFIPGFRIGTKATSVISAGEVYLSVPVKLIMDAGKAFEGGSGVSSLLNQLSSKYGNRDNFHELLFFLMYEYFSGDVDSFYWPYLSLLPRPDDLDIPLLWNSDGEVFDKLRPSVVKSSVDTYRKTVRNTFDKVSKIGIIRNFFGLDAPSDDGVIGGASILTFENYRWATAILDSRSIWWNGERHLVPLLDLVNCAEGPPSHRVHSTSLSDNGESATTKAGWNFSVDEQVFEQYGQPNHIYFMYHGFVLPTNSFDCVNIEMTISEVESNRIDWKKYHSLFQKLGMRDENSIFRYCLKETVAESVWVFLSLKLHQVENMITRSNLGSPSKEAAATLLDLVNERLRGYDEYFTEKGIQWKTENSSSFKKIMHNEPTAITFLKSEYRIFESVMSELVKLIRNLDTNNLSIGRKSEL